MRAQARSRPPFTSLVSRVILALFFCVIPAFFHVERHLSREHSAVAFLDCEECNSSGSSLPSGRAIRCAARRKGRWLGGKPVGYDVDAEWGDLNINA